MKQNVLFVDDDRILRRLVEKKLAAYAEDFTTLMAVDGLEAVEKLRENEICLVATDLNMPRMDGFSLLAHLSEFYPTLPVIILSAFGTEASQWSFAENGTAALMEKPFGAEELARKIKATLKSRVIERPRQAISLPTFLRLVAMEQKTATIRVVNGESKNRGVLFIRDGVLLDARISGIQGQEAATEIISWKRAILSIQDVCVVKEKRIVEDLQTILRNELNRKHPRPSDSLFGKDGDGEKPEPFSTRESIEKHLLMLLRGRPGLEAVQTSREWDPMVAQVSELGRHLGAGELKTCFISSGDQDQTILFTGGATIKATLSAEFPREIIRSVLYA